MNCPFCGANTSDGDLNCKSCGKELSAAKPLIGLGKFLRRCANGKTKTMAVILVITMLVSVLLLAIGGLCGMCADMRAIPAIRIANAENLLDKIVGSYEDMDSQKLEEHIEFLKAFHKDSNHEDLDRYARCYERFAENPSVYHAANLLQAAEEAKTIGRGIVATSAAGVIKVVSILIMGSCGLCAAFALLGGLFKSWEWSITSVVFSFAVQMLLAGAVVAALTAAVLLAQSVLCACVRKDYLRYLNGR